MDELSPRLRRLEDEILDEIGVAMDAHRQLRHKANYAVGETLADADVRSLRETVDRFMSAARAWLEEHAPGVAGRLR